MGKSVTKTLFNVKVCYGLPSIAAICGEATFKGNMGIAVGFGLIAPGMDAVLANVEPSAGLTVDISAGGVVLGFKGYVKGSVGLITVKLPASAIAEFLKYRSGGVYLGWEVILLKVTLSAGVQFPSITCKGKEELLAQIEVASPRNDKMRTWISSGKRRGTGKSDPESLAQVDLQTSSKAHELIMEDAADRAVVGLWRRRRRGKGFFGGIGSSIAKAAKAVAKVATKVVKAIVKCRNVYGPKTFMKFPGKKLSGSIIEKNGNYGSCKRL